MASRVLAVVAVAGCSAPQPALIERRPVVGEPVIVDTDSAYFADDGVALAMLLARPDVVSVRAITLVAGNYAPLQGVEYMAHVLEIVNRPDIPVYLGADHPLENDAERVAVMKRDFHLGFSGAFDRRTPAPGRLDPPFGGLFSRIRPRPESAVDAIIGTVEHAREPLTIVALGPMTNLAIALRRDPAMIHHIRRLVFMGGNVHVPGNVTPYAEFNFWFDPEAAQVVLRSPIREKIMIGLDLTNQALLTKARFDEATELDGPLVDLFRYDRGERSPGFLRNPEVTTYIWDALVAAYLIDPTIATRAETQYLDVITEFGREYGGVRMRAGRPGDVPIIVLTGLDFDKFFRLYKALLGGRAPSS